MGFLDSKSFNETNTTNNVENKHATAGADGFAVGANSNVVIEENSDEIAKAAFDATEFVARDAFDANRDISGRAFDLADDTVERLEEFGNRSLNTVADTLGQQGKGILDFADRTLASNKDLVEKQLESNNRFARDQSELIAAQAGVVAPTENKRNQMIVAGSLVLVGVIVFGPQLLAMFKEDK
jgi:hypothetical protein